LPAQGRYLPLEKGRSCMPREQKRERTSLFPLFCAIEFCQRYLLGMGNDVAQHVAFAFDGEVKPPPFGHPRLPYALCLIVFLGTERRMAQVLYEEFGLFIECLLNLGRGALVVFAKA